MFIHAYVKFYFLNMWDLYEFGIVNDSRLLFFLRSLEKGVLWKFWLDPQFPWDPKLKWILKWLPPDRGYFKVYFFTKKESFLIILCHRYLSTRNLVILFQVIVCITMHFIPVKCLAFRYYWSTIPRKRGGMETLARSSVSLSPQVRVKFKLTASR